jgi:hypothetical protein
MLAANPIVIGRQLEPERRMPGGNHVVVHVALAVADVAARALAAASEQVFRIDHPQLAKSLARDVPLVMGCNPVLGCTMARFAREANGLPGTLVAALRGLKPYWIVASGAPLFYFAAELLALLADDALQNLAEAQTLDRLHRPRVGIARNPDSKLATAR